MTTYTPVEPSDQPSDNPNSHPQEADNDTFASIGYSPDDDGGLNIRRDEATADETGVRNFSRVGAARPSALTYTYGPGAIMDLPNFTVMPAGLAAWEGAYTHSKREVHAPRLLEAVQYLLGNQVSGLRGYPRPAPGDEEGKRFTGIPARIFPQMLRCTTCHFLGRPDQFTYKNTAFSRPDLAHFEHNCRKKGQPVVPAPYLLACTSGHLDEFPYEQFVHKFAPCPGVKGGGAPVIHLVETGVGRSTSSMIECKTCGATRRMSEASGDRGKSELPRCRGRHPHLDSFDDECGATPERLLVGASNLWFSATQSVVVMPTEMRLSPTELKTKLQAVLTPQDFAEDGDSPRLILKLARKAGADLPGVTEEDVADALAAQDAEATSLEVLLKQRTLWDPITLLEPEWRYLASADRGQRDVDELSGLVTAQRNLDSAGLPDVITRVLAVEKLRKATAVIGFTRVDAMDRIADLGASLAPLTSDRRPTWVPTAEDRGEGMFLQFDERAISAWEQTVITSSLWEHHRAAHRRNFENRMSETGAREDPDERFPAPRFWLLHTLSHLLIRAMAVESGYGAASISERIYAWPAKDKREPAAGILLHTTASDSDGTLGGLVQLSTPSTLKQTIDNALRHASRCSTDPVCASRIPEDPEDFLHGAACHCCCMASETSCENANRFLDRKLLLKSPYSDVGFFDPVW